MAEPLGSGGVPEDVSRLRVRTVEILPGEVVLIDQLALPHEERYVRCHTWREVAARITDMTVRGAPAIGVTAAGGLALAAAAAAAASPGDPNAFRAALEQAASGLLATRPTAVNLRWAVDEMRLVWTACDEPPAACAALLLARAQAILEDDIERCLRIGEHGSALFKAGDTILTHCNAGALATAGYGTALGVVRAAFARHGGISVLVDETRPWLQGARLTAWELGVEGIPYRLISDNMAGHFIQRGAAAQREVDGGERRGDVERDAVLFGQHRDGVRADLVGRVAVGGDAVGADDHAVHGAALDEVPGHVVADEAVRDALDAELPGREPGALQPGARLVDEDRDAAVPGEGRADDAQGGAVAGRRQGAGVAVREDGVAGLEERGPVLADAQAALDVVFEDRLRAGEQQGRAGGRRLVARSPDEPHLVHGPAQVDGGGPRGQQAARGLLERGPKGVRVAGARGGGRGGRERQPAGRRDADGRGAAHRHIGDARGDLLPGMAAHVALLARERALVDQHDLAGQDLDGAHAQARNVLRHPAAAEWFSHAAAGSGALVPGGEVLGLLLGERVALDVHGLELDAVDIVVDVSGHHVDLVLERGVVLDHVLGAQRLVGEAHVHDGRRVALGRRKVDQPAFGQQVQTAAVGHGVLLDELANGALLHGELLEGRDVDLDVEVAGVGDDRAVLHDLEVLAAQHVDVAGGGDEQLGHLGGLGDGHDAVAVHDRFERAQRVDLEHDDVGAVALHAHREPAPAPAVAGQAHGAAGDEDVGGADDPVEGALAGAVAVVEHVLRVGLVDGHDGEHQPALGLERLEADDAGGGLFGAAYDVGGHVGTFAVQHADDVGAVVHGDVGPLVKEYG